MERELFYVRDGVMNNGAIGFNIPISSDLDALHFLWWNGDYTSSVNYKIMVTIEDSEVMFQPSLNISHSGQVPKVPTYWRMSLPCQTLISTTSKAADRTTDISIKFELGSNLKFVLHRLKYCRTILNEDVKPGIKPAGISSHVVFVYSLLIAFIVALFLGIFVTFMQKKYEAKLAKNVMLAKNGIHQDDPSPLLPPIENANFQAPNNPGERIDQNLIQQFESKMLSSTMLSTFSTVLCSFKANNFLDYFYSLRINDNASFDTLALRIC